MCVHGEGDLFAQPARLLAWHRAFLWRWYEVDPGDPNAWWHREALIGAERGAAKTELLAWIATLEFAGPAEFRRQTPVIHVAAASWDQAGELFRQIQIQFGGQAQTVPQAPLCGLFDVFETEIRYKDGSPGKIERLAAVAGTNEGGKTTLFLGDELHEWTGRKGRLWTVITAALTKRMIPGRSIGISTAGVGRGSIPPKPADSLLWRLYARGLLERNRPDSRYLFDWVELDERWNLDDPAELREGLRRMRSADVTWSVEVRAGELESKKMPRHEWLRYFGNRFVDVAADSWLAEHPHAWAAGRTSKRVPDGCDVVVGVDMALRHDSVGVIVAGLVDGFPTWEPFSWAPDGGGRIDHMAVTAAIRDDLAARYRVRSVVYDPRFFEVPAQILRDAGIDCIEFPQSPERLIPADGFLFELVTGGDLRHPDDPVLNRHAGAAAWRETERGRYLAKSISAGHMDLIRAGSMATWELLQGAPEDEDGPLVMVVGG